MIKTPLKALSLTKRFVIFVIVMFVIGIVGSEVLVISCAATLPATTWNKILLGGLLKAAFVSPEEASMMRSMVEEMLVAIGGLRLF